jgi:hypothetical protein
MASNIWRETRELGNSQLPKILSDPHTSINFLGTLQERTSLKLGYMEPRWRPLRLCAVRITVAFSCDLFESYTYCWRCITKVAKATPCGVVERS